MYFLYTISKKKVMKDIAKLLGKCLANLAPKTLLKQYKDFSSHQGSLLLMVKKTIIYEYIWPF